MNERKKAIIDLVDDVEKHINGVREEISKSIKSVTNNLELYDKIVSIDSDVYKSLSLILLRLDRWTTGLDSKLYDEAFQKVVDMQEEVSDAMRRASSAVKEAKTSLRSVESLLDKGSKDIKSFGARELGLF